LATRSSLAVVLPLCFDLSSRRGHRLRGGGAWPPPEKILSVLVCQFVALCVARSVSNRRSTSNQHTMFERKSLQPQPLLGSWALRNFARGPSVRRPNARRRLFAPPPFAVPGRDSEKIAAPTFTRTFGFGRLPLVAERTEASDGAAARM